MLKPFRLSGLRAFQAVLHPGAGRVLRRLTSELEIDPAEVPVEIVFPIEKGTAVEFWSKIFFCALEKVVFLFVQEVLIRGVQPLASESTFVMWILQVVSGV